MVSKYEKKESYDALVEIKKDRGTKEKEEGELANKKKVPSGRYNSKKKTSK